MPRARSPSPPAVAPPRRASPLAPLSTRMRYVIGRGEQGVLTFEPYKSHLLPMWRFRTPAIATESSGRLESEFRAFVDEGDFVGADMARKFLQGMTRSQRYANHAGGRKYSPTSGAALPRSSSPTSNPGAADKLASAAIFRAAWERAKADEGFVRLRGEWERDKEVWGRENPDEVQRLEREREESRARKRTRGKAGKVAKAEGKGKGKAEGKGKKRGKGAKEEEDAGEEEEAEEEKGPPAKKRQRVKRAASDKDGQAKGESG